MKTESILKQYNSLPVPERKATLAYILKSEEELAAILASTTVFYRRESTRILADLGDRITDFVKENAQSILQLLQSDDPKVRMHAAQIVGSTCAADYTQELIDAINAEQTMFALPSYLLAIGSAKNMIAKEFLDAYTLKSEIDKHLHEEKSALQKALANFVSKQKVVVRILPTDVIMLSTANVNVTFAALQKAGMKPKRCGELVAFSGLSDFYKIYNLRAFTDAYIFLGTCETKELPSFLASRESAIIQRSGVTGYRLEVKGVSHEERVEIIKKCVTSCTELINTPSAYSIELIADIRDDKTMLFLNPLCDNRFSYRKKTIAASIHPGVAACVCAYASEFFNPNARVLDNFCGSGTMLFERGIYPHHTLTGVDLNADAIAAANENSMHASSHPQLHHMDALKFTAKRYDEIIVNMPFGLRVSNHSKNELLYKRYFHLLPDMLTPNGIAILYTHEKRLIESLIENNSNFTLLKRATFSAGGLYPAVYILRKN